MKIRRSDENRITVELCREDLHFLGVNPQNLNSQNQETKEILFNLLKRVSREMSCELDSNSKIIVNSNYQDDDSFPLKITLLKKYSTNEGKRPMSFWGCKSPYCIYEFSCADSLLEASFASCSESLLLKNELYEKDGRYRLVIYAKEDCFSLCVLNEFASDTFSGSIAAAQTREHWNKIISDHAISSLSLRCVL